MIVLLLLVGVALAGVVACLEYQGRLRSLSYESRLNFLETRISGVDEEFMRRSPELRANFTRFQQCIIRESCNTDPIFAERNRIVQTLWPELLERLLVSGDWGDGRLTQPYHQRFQTDIQRAGGSLKAKNCRPKIYYYLDNDRTYYTYDGLLCP